MAVSSVLKLTHRENNYPVCQIGDFKVTVIPLGQMSLDGGAMFGVVPKVLWEKLIPPDDKNRIPLALNCLLIEVGDDKIFVDAGMGTKWTDKHIDMYAIKGCVDIAQALEPLGLKTSDITKHLLTHLHFDHAGGATRYNEAGVPVPTFENATYYVHQGDWEDAHHPHARVKASYLPDNFDPLADTGRLVLLKNDSNEILPGLLMQVAKGHVPWHQIVILDTPEHGGFIYWGDIVPTHHHLKIPYVAAYDQFPVEIMETKQQLLDQACKNNWLNIFEHDLQVPWGFITWNEDKKCYSLMS